MRPDAYELGMDGVCTDVSSKMRMRMKLSLCPVYVLQLRVLDDPKAVLV